MKKLKKYFAYNFIFFLFLFSSFSYSEEYLEWGGSYESERCSSLSGFLIIDTEDKTKSCIRYYKSEEDILNKEVVIEIYGDRVNFLKKSKEEIPFNTEYDQEVEAKSLAKIYQKPVVILARPGVYGSSGNHNERRTRKEYEIVKKSILSLMQKYRLKRVDLVGQSGGATAIAGALSIGLTGAHCVILTSGAYGLAERANYHRLRNGKKERVNVDTTGRADYYDPLLHYEKIGENSFYRLLIAGDKRDKNTPFYLQKKYYEVLKNKNKNVYLISIEAQPRMYHGVSAETRSKLLNFCHS